MTAILHTALSGLDTAFYLVGVGSAIFSFKFESNEFNRCVPYNKSSYTIPFFISLIFGILRIILFDLGESKDGKVHTNF